MRARAPRPSRVSLATLAIVVGCVLGCGSGTGSGEHGDACHHPGEHGDTAVGLVLENAPERPIWIVSLDCDPPHAILSAQGELLRWNTGCAGSCDDLLAGCVA